MLFKLREPLSVVLKSAFILGLFILCQFAFATQADAQTPPTVTFQGRAVYSTGQPAEGAVVTLTKNRGGAVTTLTQVAGSGGSYTFTENQIQGQCAVSYQFQAVSLELVDDEQLPPSGATSTSGCLPASWTNADLVIARPHEITLGGIVRDTRGVPVEGLTITMTRTKYNLNPQVVTVAQTTTNAQGHYQFTTWSRCAVVEDFHVSFGTYLFTASRSISGCVIQDYDDIDLTVAFANGLADAGITPANKSVGCPVNVATGNMYLSQGDYFLPGTGAPLSVTRTYNSVSQKVGLFGLGWTTQYDETVTVDASNNPLLTLSDGRVVGVTTPDFFGQITRNANGTATVVFTDGTVHQFNSSGKLASQTDRNGNQTTLAYDTNGRLASVTDPFGRVLTVTTNSSGRVLSLSDSLGTVATYTYGGNQQLLSVTYADNSAFQFSYTGVPAGLALTTVTDALGNIVEHHDYDGQGRAITSEISSGIKKYTLSYVSPVETDVTDALGRVTKYFFHRILDRYVVTRVEGTCGCGSSQNKTWTYDGRANVASVTDALNHTVIYTYDGTGNRLTETDAAGTVTYTYNQFGQVLTRTDQMDGVTTNTFDSNGNLLTTKDALDKTTTFTHDARGQLLTITNARNKVTTLSWNTSGHLTQIQDALSQNTNYVYDARARLTSVTNALNQATSFEYDPAGRLKKAIYPDTKFVEYSYDLAGRRTKVKDPRGNETNFAYDGAYRLTSVTDALTNTSSYSYDVMSNLTSSTDELGRVTNFEYDDFNRLKKIVYPAAAVGSARLQEEITYDAVGNVTKRTDTANRDTTFLYDSVDRLIKVTDPALQATQFEYNARSQRTAVIDARNQTYSFVYDSLGQLTQSTRAGVSMSYVYDSVGNPTKRTDFNGAVTDYSYDDLNRLTTIAYPNSTATYGYDALSRMTSATNENGTVSFTYDVRGRVATTTDVWGRTLGFGYDANGNRTSLTIAGSSYATYQYDVLNRLTQVTDNAALNTGYSYDAASQLTGRTLPNGVDTNYEYDGMSRLKRLRDVKAAVSLTDYQLQYNNASNISQLTDLGGAHVYSYDNADRLTAATYPGQISESYAYDGVGNRTSSHLSASYTNQPFNRLTATTSATYTFDDAGNTTSKTDVTGEWHYFYDADNRMTEAHWPHNVPPPPPSEGGDGDEIPPPPSPSYRVTNQYDALGRRIRREVIVGGSAPTTIGTRFVYDGADVVEDLSDTGVVTARYLNGPGIDNKLRQQNAQSGATYYFLADQLGSTRALTDATGNVVEQLNYDSFGNSAGSSTTRYGYTGRERDDVTGLLYYRARFYDPQLGRFTSEDPIGFAGGINHYGYVSNNPLSFVDSLGLQPGPTNYLRDPFSVDHWILNGTANSLSDGLGLDGVAQEAWDLGNPCLEDSARAWAGAKLGGRVILVATGGPILRGLGRLGFGALNRFAPDVARRASGPLSELFSSSTAADGTGALSRLAQPGGLMVSENAGGHLLARHVGLTDADLAARLLSEPRLTAASTFATRAEAEAAVAAAFDANVANVSSWTASGANGRLTLNAPFNGGSVLQRGASAAAPGTGIRVVLQGNGSGGYHILTGFPTP